MQEWLTAVNNKKHTQITHKCFSTMVSKALFELIYRMPLAEDSPYYKLNTKSWKGGECMPDQEKRSYY